jgi:three-Cys-motif partner protein
MPSFKPTELWEAAPHTLAKIEIVRQYLVRWFQILGLEHPSPRLMYIDGFAGPGAYTNTSDSSPLAALRAAAQVLKSTPALGSKEFGFLFTEKEQWCAEHLRAVIQKEALPKQIQWEVRQESFEDGVGGILKENRSNGEQLAPTFAFIDPFGATGLPFAVIQEILSHRSCEVLLNLDSDGIARLFKASDVVKNEAHLDSLFGDGSWRSALQPDAGIRELSPQILTLYKRRLLSIPRVQYVFAFAMHNANGKLSYHLVFASQHPLGLEKMKEAMESVDKSGLYSFSDATAGQSELPFDFKQPDAFARRMQATLGGMPRPYNDFHDYALNETPFRNPKVMLELLKREGAVDVAWKGVPAKRGFPADKIETILLRQ